MLARRRLTLALVVLAAASTTILAPPALGASTGSRNARRPTAAASATARVVPSFKAYIAGETVPGRHAYLRLTRIGVLFTGDTRGEVITVDCSGCQGPNLGHVKYRGQESYYLTRLLVTARSRLSVYARRAGWIGRFKEYTLQPRLREHRLVEQGCLAVDVFTPIDCAAGTAEYVGPGTLFEPSCPANPCLAITRVSGYQLTAGSLPGVSTVRASGYVTTWDVALSRPNSGQVSFFDSLGGGPAEAAVAVLAPEPSPSSAYRLVAQSPVVDLQPYLGLDRGHPARTAAEGRTRGGDRPHRAYLGASAGAGVEG